MPTSPHISHQLSACFPPGIYLWRFLLGLSLAWQAYGCSEIGDDHGGSRRVSCCLRDLFCDPPQMAQYWNPLGSLGLTTRQYSNEMSKIASSCTQSEPDMARYSSISHWQTPSVSHSILLSIIAASSIMQRAEPRQYSRGNFSLDSLALQGPVNNPQRPPISSQTPGK